MCVCAHGSTVHVRVYSGTSLCTSRFGGYNGDMAALKVCRIMSFGM